MQEYCLVHAQDMKLGPENADIVHPSVLHGVQNRYIESKRRQKVVYISKREEEERKRNLENIKVMSGPQEEMKRTNDMVAKIQRNR